MGWDPTPRMNPRQRFDGRGYPNTPVIVNNTPGNFLRVLEQIKTKLSRSAPPLRILTINAWNEWGEGSYLEPDMETGTEYLNTICMVFCDAK